MTVSPVRLPAGFLAGGRFADWRPDRPRYVVADVDGTLVGASGIATDRVVEAARDAAAGGLAVGFATGRMRLAVGALWERLRLPGPHILHNGAEVRASGETIAAWPIPSEGVDTILGIAADLDVYVEIYVEEGFLVSRWDQRARPHWDLLGFEPLGVVGAATDVDGPVLKATFGLFDRAAVDPVVTALEKAGLAAGPAGSPITPTITYVNATDPSVDKGAAVLVAAAHVGASPEEIVAVGDARNDLPMLAVAGTAVAMGQAEAEVIAAAHLVAPSVDADGVANVLDAAPTWGRRD